MKGKPMKIFDTGNKKSLLKSGSDESGIALVTALLIMVLLSLLAAAAVNTTSIGVKISSNYQTSVSAFYVADAGLEAGRNYLHSNFDVTNGWTGFLTPRTYCMGETSIQRRNISDQLPTYSATSQNIPVGNGAFTVYTMDDVDGDGNLESDGNKKIYLTSQGTVGGSVPATVVVEEYMEFYQSYASYGGKDLTSGGTNVATGEVTWQ